MFQKTIKPILVIFASLALLSLAGCDLFSGITVTAIVTNVTIGLNTNAVGEIDLLDGTAPITDATVTVNGIDCPGDSSGVYSLPAATAEITGNTTVTLVISVPSKSLTVTKTLTMPNITTITAPTAVGGPYNNATTVLTVNWDTVTPAPNQIELLVPTPFTTSSTSYFKILSGALLTYDIPIGTIKAGQTNVPVNVIPSNTMSIAGSGVKIGSVFTVGNTATNLINTTP